MRLNGSESKKKKKKGGREGSKKFSFHSWKLGIGEKNGDRANLIKQRCYDLVPGYTKGVQKQICTPFAYPDVQACTHFHLTPSMNTLCTPKKDESVRSIFFATLRVASSTY
jgi:hypothetical protein